MCLCCLGWGLFLWNYLNGQGRAPTVDDIKPNTQILAGQGGVAFLDYFFWTGFFGLSGSSLYTVIFIFDFMPFLAQSLFVYYLITTTSKVKAVDAIPMKASCCSGGGDAEMLNMEKASMLV